MSNEIIPYKKELRDFARELRKNPTEAEGIFWDKVRRRRVLGYQFHRQVPMLHYIVDFYCHELRLVIEIDGGYHHGNESYDLPRQSEIENLGIHVLRFDNKCLFQDPDAVIREIKVWINENAE